METVDRRMEEAKRGMMGYDMTNIYSTYSYSHWEGDGDNKGRKMEAKKDREV